MSKEVEMLLNGLGKGAAFLGQFKAEDYTKMYSAFWAAKATAEPYLVDGIKTICAAASCSAEKEEALLFSAKTLAFAAAAYMVVKGVEFGANQGLNLGKKIGTKLFAFNAFKDLHDDVKGKNAANKDQFKDAFVASLNKKKK